jgi:predicted GNAT family acetyltransferase
MSLYADYLKERTNDQIIESEKGFATYRFLNDKSVYIVDLYVKPEFRKQGVASDFSAIIMERAKERGCTKMIGSVVPSAHGSTESVKVLFAHGMRIESCTNDFVLFSKEIP